MGILVNLRNARKRKAREEAATAAATARLHFGRSRQQKEADRAQLDSEQKRFEAHRREAPDAKEC